MRSIFVKQSSSKDRQLAFQQMENVLDKAAEDMKNIPDDEFNEAIDEAANHIRKRTE